MLGTCSENDENGCGFGMPLEAAENRKLFFLVTKVLPRRKFALNRPSRFDSLGLKTEERRNRNRQMLCSHGEVPNCSELGDTDVVFVANFFAQE